MATVAVREVAPAIELGLSLSEDTKRLLLGGGVAFAGLAAGSVVPGRVGTVVTLGSLGAGALIVAGVFPVFRGKKLPGFAPVQTGDIILDIGGESWRR